MKLLGKIGLAGVLVLAAYFLAASPCGGTEVYSDNFNDNTLNPGYKPETFGTGPGLQETNQRLEMTIPAGSAGTDGDNNIGEYLWLGHDLAGDYEVQVDFNLLTWQPASGAEVVEVGISTENGCVLYRSSFGPSAPGGQREVYGLNFGGQFFGVITSDISGKLKMKRTGNLVEGFFWQNNAWHLIGSIVDPQLASANEFSITLNTWGVNSINQTVQIAFDNYQQINDIARLLGTWGATYPLNTSRYGHTATLLNNGKVLVAGGFCIGSGIPGHYVKEAELYDPANGTWSISGSLTDARSGHTATRLGSGKVLVTGGAPAQSSVELYDPTTGI